MVKQTKKRGQLQIALGIVLVCLFIPFITTYGQVDTIKVFKAHENGYDNYRIPALVSTKGGTLLAFAEGRKHLSDAGDIDLVCKRSADGGKTWSDQQVVWDDGENTCGNPCPVVDQKTGTIWLVMTHNLGQDHEKDIIRGTSQESREIWVCKSMDDGRTWSVPQEITPEVKNPTWGWYATGPGIGIQISKGPYAGRLVIPADFSYQDSSGNGSYQYGSCSFFSDDGGITWQPGGTIAPKMNECQVAEVPGTDGMLIMNMRSYRGKHCRAISFSRDGGMSWSPASDDPSLIEPVCQGSFISYHGKRKHALECLLFLNPADSAVRRNMTLRASFDGARSWPVQRVLYGGPAAYSSLAELPSGNIGALYEAGSSNPYEYIVFQLIKPEEIFGKAGRKVNK